MATKKAPAKKTPPPSRTDKKGTSGMGKTQRNVVKRTDKSGSSGMGKTSPMTKRTDKAGHAGMGMTKSGVKARAYAAGKEEINKRSWKGGITRDEYSDLAKSVTVEEFSPKDPMGKKAFAAESKAKREVYKKYGMAKKKK